MGLLTDFFTDVATSYVSRPQINVAGPTGYPPGGGFGLPTTPAIGIPFYDLVPEAPVSASGCGPKPVYKMVCGQYKWVIPKRKRRKQLLTASDAAGLANLVNILGNGKATAMWIASRKA